MHMGGKAHDVPERMGGMGTVGTLVYPLKSLRGGEGTLMSKSTEQGSVRVLLLEEEALVRAALQALVTSWEGFEVVAEAATKDEALQQLRRSEPHVILLSLGGTD